MLSKYDKLISQLEPDVRRHVHYNSLKNFVLFLDKFESSEERVNVENQLNNYLKIIEENIDSIDAVTGVEFFEKIVSPIGKEYKKIGFKRITPVRYLFINSAIIDFLLFLAFYPLFVPWVTLLVILYYFLWIKPMYKSKKAYGLFY